MYTMSSVCAAQDSLHRAHKQEDVAEGQQNEKNAICNPNVDHVLFVQTSFQIHI